jgi:hypothetical protein
MADDGGEGEGVSVGCVGMNEGSVLCGDVTLMRFDGATPAQSAHWLELWRKTLEGTRLRLALSDDGRRRSEGATLPHFSYLWPSPIDPTSKSEISVRQGSQTTHRRHVKPRNESILGTQNPSFPSLR